MVTRWAKRYMVEWLQGYNFVAEIICKGGAMGLPVAAVGLLVRLSAGGRRRASRIIRDGLCVFAKPLFDILQ
jgi:hypothetical protein